MIRLLDTNALFALYASKQIVPNKFACAIPDEIKAEFLDQGEVEEWYQRCAFSSPDIDDVDFLIQYAKFLNRYTDISFYGLKGFGDVAMVATLSLLTQKEEYSFLFESEPIYLVTDDRKLRRFVTDEFGKRITLETLDQFIHQL
jgi:hypothetical protein